MKKIFPILIFIIFCAQHLCAQSQRIAPPLDASKYIQVDDANHDFGNMVYGKPVHYPVHIKNISADTIVLTDIVVSCGCTTPQYKTGAYAPGDVIDITIGYSGIEKGQFKKTISVIFQDDKAGQFVQILRFNGNGVVQKENN